MAKPALENYQSRLNEIYEDMFLTGLEKWKEGDNGDAIEIADWLSSVKDGGFIDYDGYGNFAFKKADGDFVHTRISVSPSDITRWEIKVPSWVTHVIWYNR